MHTDISRDIFLKIVISWHEFKSWWIKELANFLIQLSIVKKEINFNVVIIKSIRVLFWAANHEYFVAINTIGTSDYWKTLINKIVVWLFWVVNEIPINHHKIETFISRNRIFFCTAYKRDMIHSGILMLQFSWVPYL